MKSVFVAVLLLGMPALAQEIVLQQLAEGIEKPVGIAHANDARLFVVTQRGRILIYDGSRILEQPFLDITPQVSCCGERGLLGLAFHPQFDTNGYFYIDYLDFDGSLVIERYSVSARDASAADSRSGVSVMIIDHLLLQPRTAFEARSGWSPRLLLQSSLKISSFGEDVNGELYLLDYGGGLYRIRDAFPFASRRRAVRH